MFTIGNGSSGVSVVCTLGACTGGGGRGPISVVLFNLGVVCAMGLGFLWMLCYSGGFQGPLWPTAIKHHGWH